MTQASQFFLITFSQFYQEKERGGKYLSFVGSGQCFMQTKRRHSVLLYNAIVRHIHMP